MGDSQQEPHHRHRRQRHKKPERSAVGICTKYILFFENFILVLLGAAMTALGSYILILKEKIVHDVIEFFLDPACDLCLAGSVICTMGLLGAIGALREITCCLKVYYILLGLILMTEFALATLMFVSYYVPEVKDTVFPKDTFQNAIINYRNDPDMKNFIDSLQENLECCGLSNSDQGFQDWTENIYFNCSTFNHSPERCSVPFSCCRRYKGDKINYQCGANMLIAKDGGDPQVNHENTENIYTDGCLKALGDWIDVHSLIVGGVMLGIILPQTIVMVLTKRLMQMIAIQKSKWDSE